MSDAETPVRGVRWHSSLIVRVIVLCIVLLMCLFGAVYVISEHYYYQAVAEMRNQARQIAESVRVRLEQMGDDPNYSIDKLLEDVRAETGAEQFDIHIDPEEQATAPTDLHTTIEHLDTGERIYIASQTIPAGDNFFRFTASVTTSTRTEVMRAFRNKYLLLLTLVFVVALGLMIYTILHVLRPIGELAESCASISAGNLKPVATGRGGGEVLALERTFNRMVESLKEKELVEANLRQAQRLSAIGNLAAGVAHDVRNPLNAIKLLSSHALDTLYDKTENAVAIRQLETIRREVDRLEDIVSGFLSLAKERELKFEKHRLDALLEECASLVKQDAESRDVRLITELRAGDTMLQLDAKQWTRAILNILINALEACPAGGRVRMFSRVTETACEIEIRDDGPGIPKEVLERAFDAYFTTKPTGTGLGLSISRGIVEEHGGSISLTSVGGQGTQVLITVPLDQPRRV